MSPPPNHDFQEWWNKEKERDQTLFSNKSENPNWSTVEIGNPIVVAADSAIEKDRSRNARQLSWVYLLKFQQAFNAFIWLTNGFVSLIRTANRRIASSSPSRTESRLYRVIKVFLVLVILLLVFELLAYFKGWHFSPPSVADALDLVELVYATWLNIRVNYLAPPLQNLANVCIVLFLIQSVDRIVLVLGCIWIKFRGLKPIAMMEFSGDIENENAEDYPMVLLQIPMCNEREVYQQSIAAICIQDWPRDRMLIQVLDDSDDLECQHLIKAEVQKWQQKGVRIVYRHRLIRTGYKAGNLKSAMSCDYVKDYEFVAIFDADFQPGPDFLKKTVPHFKGHDDLALVQTRWAFVNKDENLLTRLQNINLTFHFEVEQQVNGIFINFFGFNGTAGVWRIKALEECGGWMERTTVEDMDIAVRAHLCGWKFIYLNDVKSLCELPESYEAYKKQQHRWHSGPMQLFRLCFFDILRSKITWPKKANLILLFFLLRKLILPFYSFTLFCIILPLTMFLPEAQLPAWVVCYVPGVMSILSILPAPRSFPFIVPYLLFENTMSVTKFNAMISGLFKLGSSYEWIVTKKLGRSSEADLIAFAEKESDPQVEINSFHRASSDSGLSELNKLELAKKTGKNKKNRLYRKELALAFILLTASVRSLLSAQGIHFYFLLFQGITFLIVGLDLIGEQVYQQSIAAICIQDWPRSRMLVQVLDDSDDPDVQLLIKAEVLKWLQKGVRILYRNRLIRTGYKAGNLKSAISCDYVKDYEFVALFDADFQPGPDFLKKTIPYFKGNDDVALVQTRWDFVNKDENLLTRLQNINLSFHFEVEQHVNGVFVNFFGFNGTAGVWRITALEDCGGWMDRTTVEDMDIAVRAHLCGWKFIYLNDVKCLCELPESYEAYKKQQHRWHSGPMQLFRLCFFDILRSKISRAKKANLILLFFLLRKLVLPFYSFTLFCIILPLTMFLPEAQLPAWVVCYVPGIMSILNILPAPRSFPFIVRYLLFENTMSVTKFNAMISGLFKFGSSYEWVVTKKLGRSSEGDLIALAENETHPLAERNGLGGSSSESDMTELNKLEAEKKLGKCKRNRLYRKELALAFILLSASARNLLSAQGIHLYFLLFQGITFLVVGLDLIGEQVN